MTTPFHRLSIQSKLLLILLGVSIASMFVVAGIGYFSGREAVIGAVRNQLAGVCRIKTTLVVDRLQQIRGQVISLSADETFVTAMKSYIAGFDDLNDSPIPPEWDDKLTAFYRDDFLPLLKSSLDADPVLENYVPRIVASRYLQYQYLARNPSPYRLKHKLDSSGDGSPYDAAHKRFHPYFRLIRENLGFDDVVLIDSKSGEVVYSEQKSVEFATNLLTGPYANSNLGELFRAIQKGMDRDDFRLVDFQRYRPNGNLPTSFIGSPIFDDNKMIGVLVLKFPIDQFSRILTGDEGWRREGLGSTGEAYLVGADHYMRSRSREIWEIQAVETSGPDGKPLPVAEVAKRREAGLERFLDKLRDAGTTEQGIAMIRRSGTSVLSLRVESEAARLGTSGITGTVSQRDYRGVPTLASFTPIELPGLIGGEKNRWAVVAKMDMDEALEPVRRFQRWLITTAVAIVLVVSLLALMFSRIFTRPLRQLTRGARRVSEGQVDVKVKVRSRDEFHELAEAFNRMTSNLKAKNELIDQKVRENEELLLNILPSSAVKRRKEGEKQFSENFADVTVLFARMHGLSETLDGKPADETLGLLNELVIAFDEAAEKHGVEKVKTVGESYMAVCGLSVQRPDHTNRVVEFAKDMLRIVRRFNKDRLPGLTLSIAVNSGPVVGGVVGMNKFIYDLWGDTVVIAQGLIAKGDANSIQVTRDVRDRLGDLQEFEPLGELELSAKGMLPVWRVKF
ncbi:adenylate/guanylate cyclase domain-containing protein [Paludisphaera mucosa]|uniref:Adenylate/guanylate cyclase domain-containing protein n=1 Tax=Paludisphaera mucosa TaxID=3030827 RepID=A0ABT6F8A0_9BACT|nr:adenylate/guanylate cyclase domain-containing protein [Paludisphaera mucosa]MDG3003613.1 adenylate/guanylate cyclase domain-containing protein [Paludisphaera mucosa]